MPTIQQEHGVKTVKGLPTRWGRRAYRELAAVMKEHGTDSDRYRALADLLDEVTAAPLPLDATDAHLCVLAERYAGDCAAAAVLENVQAPTGPAPIEGGPRQLGKREGITPRERMAKICAVHGIEPPKCQEDAEAVARMLDSAWWRRGLRRTHGRTFEAAAIRLGFVSVRAGAYASDETTGRRLAQVARNRAALESVKIKNEDGFECTLADAASKTTSNKRIRRGELMLRLAGCEEIAIEAGHVGIFFTLTAPSKYHAVLAKTGTVNPTYNDATPREVQQYLQKTWAKIRAAYGRHNIRPYGFRIAEPHHDGCVHWHGLVFMPAYKVRRFCRIVKQYALAEDGTEPGAAEHRAKFERIDTEKGSAAAYIAKYISKNIDDDTEDAHDEVIGADGQPVKITMPSDGAKKASQRVDAWAGVWGIKQFQPIGQPPVTVWRELRRVSEAAIKDAPANVRAAWDACQRVHRTDKETGEVTVERPANFAAYIRAQGGVCVGRNYRIGIAHEPTRIEGRYGVYEGMAPVGIFARIAPDTVYSSTRYTWTKSAARGGVASPWSPVNNCTESPWPARPQTRDHWTASAPEPGPVADFADEWFSSDEFQHVYIDPVDQLAMLERSAVAAFEQDRISRAVQHWRKYT
ncbi:MAG: replication endonuclease [Xanthobacteraceae bacterium]